MHACEVKDSLRACRAFSKACDAVNVVACSFALAERQRIVIHSEVYVFDILYIPREYGHGDVKRTGDKAAPLKSARSDLQHVILKEAFENINH